MQDSTERTAQATAEPAYINGMFGWLHRPQPDSSGDTAVLICSPLSRDALDAHRFQRVLADSFAAAGYPALRFDYPGTGDSQDIAEFPDDSIDQAGNHWTIWLQAVQLAADHLMEATGATRLIICGLRVGATLATLAAERRADVTGLILLAPVIRGQSYIRQLWVQSGLQQGQTTKLQDGFTLMELAFNAAAVQSIAAADLRTVKMPAGRQIAICAQSPSAPLTACEATWQAQGATIWSTDFSGLESLLSHELDGDTEAADFTGLLDWTNRNFPPHPQSQPVTGASRTATVQRAGYTETPLRFGAQSGIFGMLCQPAGAQTDIAVVMCGGGRNPHYGAGRAAVQLARTLAADGFASLRIDFAGLGDSIGPAGRETMMTGLFEPRLADIQAAIDQLASLGYRRFAVQGLCSGAFHAFHAGLDDPRIGMLLLVNIPLFEATEGCCDQVNVRAVRPWHYYIKQLAFRQSWGRLFSGKYDIGTILRGRIARLRDMALQKLRNRAAEPAKNFARIAVRKLGQRGVQTLFLFGPDEIGFYVVEEHFGPQGAELQQIENVTLHLADKFDHLMSASETQTEASRIMLAQLHAWHDAGRSAATPAPAVQIHDEVVQEVIYA